MKKLILAMAGGAAILAMSSSAMAATSVAWLSPPANSHYATGTAVTVTGNAVGQGQTGGSGLDLVLVMDSSGSMYGSGQTAQRSAALALVAALPQATTSVGIVDFDSYASTKLGLTQLNGTNTAVNNAINSINASGGTAIHAGVTKGNEVLGSAAATASRSQVMVVMSDGGSSVSLADSAADAAMASNTEAIHSVGMGTGAQASSLQAVVNGVNDVYGDADDYGTYQNSSIAGLISLFNGTGGNLVGLDYIDITDPNGVLSSHWALDDGLGNFSINWTLASGANVFQVDAYGTDNSSATAYITLYGDDPTGINVPEPATLALMGISMLGFGATRRRKVRK